MLLAFLAVSLYILEKTASTTHAEVVIRVLRGPYFDTELIKKKVKNAEDCCVILSKLTKTLQNEQ